MLQYSLLEENKKELTYEYFPEGNMSAGVVSYNKETGECNIIKQSEADKHRIYALKMFKKIRDFAADGKFLKTGLVAWY